MTATAPTEATTITQQAIEQFLYREARYLDDREFEKWLDCYADDVEYWMPSWRDDELLSEDPQTEISLIYYPNKGGLSDRVFRIKTERSSATSLPEPRTSHNITNVEVIERRGDLVDVRFNWHTMYFRYRTVDPYYGTSFYTIDFSGVSPLIRRKTVVLKNDYIHHVVDIDDAGHQVALAFEDGVTRFITCREDQTVADASYRQRINIPLDCRDGACGTCKALCESGNYDGGTYIDDALPPDEAAAGYVLPCSMKPRSDLVLQIASTSDVAKTQAATYTGALTKLDRLSATTVAIGVEIPNRAELAFLPGQYVNIAVPGTDQSRSYSFSNAPRDKLLTFLVKLTRGGAMSEYLASRACIGDSISFTGPNGSFFLREADHPVLLLAGGTGLAPVLSMLRSLRDANSQRKAHLVYGVSSD